MNNTHDTSVILDEHTVVSKAFYDHLRQQVRLALPALVPGVSYSPEVLCGRDYWDRLQRWQQIAARKCMAYMVVHRQLPLTFGKPTRGNSKTYRLK